MKISQWSRSNTMFDLSLIDGRKLSIQASGIAGFGQARVDEKRAWILLIGYPKELFVCESYQEIREALTGIA